MSNDPQQPNPSTTENGAGTRSPELSPQLASLADQADLIESPAAAVPSEPAPAPSDQDVPTAEFLEGMLAPLAELAPHIHHGFAVKPIKPHEVKMLAVGWAAVLDHYFPKGVASWGPWGIALGATAAVVGPRLVVPAPAPAPSA